MQDSEMLWIIQFSLIIRVKYSAFKDALMNTVPILYSTSNLRILLLEFATDSMELCKKPAPFDYNFPISHPLKLNKNAFINILCLHMLN